MSRFVPILATGITIAGAAVVCDFVNRHAEAEARQRQAAAEAKREEFISEIENHYRQLQAAVEARNDTETGRWLEQFRKYSQMTYAEVESIDRVFRKRRALSSLETEQTPTGRLRLYEELLALEPQNREYRNAAKALRVELARQQQERREQQSRRRRIEIESAISNSDDFDRHKEVFVRAAMELIRNGTCTLDQLRFSGGWVKSTTTYKHFPVYFTYCGEGHVSNRIYLDASTGELFR